MSPRSRIFGQFLRARNFSGKRQFLVQADFFYTMPKLFVVTYVSTYQSSVRRLVHDRRGEAFERRRHDKSRV